MIVKVRGGKDPTIAGEIFDANGDGIPDSIVVTVTAGASDGAYTADSCSKTYYAWPTTTPLVSLGSFTVSGSQLVARNVTGISQFLTSGNGAIAGVFGSAKDSISGVLVDKMGPVIISAQMKEVIDTTNPDSVIVKFSEGVSGISAANIKYLNVNGVATNVLGAVELNGDPTKWLFVFAAGTVVPDQDSMNIAVSGGIVDLVGNIPNVNNRKVLVVTLEEPRTISPDGNLYLDVNADGTMDSITLRFSGAPLKASKVAQMTFHIPWKTSAGSDTTFDIKGADMTVPGGLSAVIGWKVPAGTKIAAYKTSLDSVKPATFDQLDTNGSPMTDTINMQDGMAPVVVSAEYLDLATGTDTLFVTLSEVAKGSLDGTPFEIGQGGTFVAPTLKSLSSNGATYAFALTSGNAPNTGDSIYISTVFGLSDLASVKQDNANNIRQPLNIVRQSGFRFWYVDIGHNGIAQPDGLIDSVKVDCGTAVPAAFDSAFAAELVKVLPVGREFNVGDVTYQPNGFSVAVTQNDAVPKTGILAGDTIALDKLLDVGGMRITPQTVTAEDSLAPVIVSASYTYGQATGFGVTRKDQLTVIFSEPVNKATVTVPGDLFQFKTDSSVLYSASELTLLSSSGDTEFTFDDTLTGVRPFVGNNDSIDLRGTVGVSDAHGLAQKLSTVFVRFHYVSDFAPLFEAKVFPVPYSLSGSNSAAVGMDDFKTKFEVTGSDCVYMVYRPFGPIPGAMSLKGEMKIYDVLGNLVATVESMDRSNKSGYNSPTSANKDVLIIPWDGINSNGRKVSGGSYIGIVNIYDAGKSINIGDAHRQRIVIMH